METFYKAFFVPRVNICGFSLSDFSYNHLAILRAIDSPFVSFDPDRIIKAADLITALKVCSSVYPDREFKYTFRDKTKAYMLSMSQGRLQREAFNFSCYIEENQQLPQFWEFENNSSGWSPSSSPDELSTITLLIKNNIEHNKAWNMSIGYANWLSATLLEQAGNPRVFADPEEDESIIDLNEQSEEYIRKIALEQLGETRYKDWLKAREERGA